MREEFKYAVIDVETGGTDPTRHPLIEVGYVLEDGTEIEFSLPFDEQACSPEALKVNGWRPSEGKERRQFAPMVTYDVGVGYLRRDFADRLLVASPAHFDMGFIEAFYRQYSGESFRLPWSHRAVIDLKSLYCGRMSRVHAYGNRTMARNLGVTDDSDHSALQDAKYTARMFEAVIHKMNPDWGIHS